MNNDFDKKKNEISKEENKDLNNKSKIVLKSENLNKKDDFLLNESSNITPVNVSSVTVKVIDSKLNTEVSHIDNLISERKKKNKFKKINQIINKR
ncbi:MAG: hypothetical protein K2I76_00245 [Malacoplasma sp.]|nr:hypothetical protein [Malacoplasma sp.]